MAEVRVEIPNDELSVLDGYCSATSESRTDVIRELLAAWSKKKFHEATVILRVAGGNPDTADIERSHRGAKPK